MPSTTSTYKLTSSYNYVNATKQNDIIEGHFYRRSPMLMSEKRSSIVIKFSRVNTNKVPNYRVIPIVRRWW